ncbi:acyltransferase family protein [Corynebacterium sp. H78]|uniref:acyltransferase family protein n=1 Tax=Corynebacterium sp. H78 TaxID=3133417 RepID=UPI0030A5CB56
MGSPSTVRRVDLDGLRGLAIGLVVVYHVFVGRVSGGVDVFLLLTGYFFLSSQMRYASRANALINPWWPFWRTVRRLVPSLVIVLAGIAILISIFTPQLIAEDLTKQLRAALFYVLNFELISQDSDYAAASTSASPLQHLWSMSVQGQFYVFAIALGTVATLLNRLFRLRNSERISLFVIGPILIAITIASFWWASRDGLYGTMESYYSTLSRAWQLTLGGVLGIYASRIRLPKAISGPAAVVGLFMLVATGAVIPTTLAFPGPLSLLPIGGAVLVILSTSDGVASRFLSTPFMQWLGQVSYPLYLWHWPLLIILTLFTGYWKPPFWLGIGVLMISMVLANATHALVEKPLQQAKKRPTKDSEHLFPTQEERRSFSFQSKVAAAVLVAVLAGGGVMAHSGWVAYLTKLDTKRANPETHPGAMSLFGVSAPSAEPFPKMAPHLGTRSWRAGCLLPLDAKPDEFVDCEYGDTNAEVTVVVAGNSHADTLVEPLHDLGREYGFKVIPVIREACSVTFKESDLASADCVEWSKMAAQRIVDLDPDMVVTMTTTSTRGWQDDAEWVLPGAEEFWQQLADHNIPMLGLRDNPRLYDARMKPFHPNECLEQKEGNIQECAVPRERIYNPENPADQVLAQWPTAMSVDTAEWFCPGGWCMPVIGNIVVYRDRDHITNAYGRSLEPVLWEYLGRHLWATGAWGDIPATPPLEQEIPVESLPEVPLPEVPLQEAPDTLGIPDATVVPGTPTL